jgi:hypothetical protein
MEQAFGAKLDDVRVHSNPAAAAAADRQDANAFALGRDVVFGSGRFAPGTPSGDRLLAHEIAHTLQQNGSGTPGEGTLEAEARGAADRAAAGAPVGNLSATKPRVLRDGKPAKEPKVLLQETLLIGMAKGARDHFATPAEMRKLMHTNPDTDPDVIDECALKQIGTPGTAGMTYRFIHPALGRIVDLVADDDTGEAWTMTFYWLPPSPAGGKGGKKGKTGTDPQGRPIKLPAELLSPDAKHPIEDPEEATRLYQAIREHLVNLPGEEGEDAVRFAHFLALNKDKIEGVLHTSKTGKPITEAEIQKIIDMYGKFIAAAPLDTPDKLEKPADFDKVLAYDPNWQKMSKQDRQMVIDAAKMKPEDLAAGKLDFSVITPTMKETIALKLADSWASEIAEAAKEAFSDPKFVISLILTIAIYIGLWLVPDPTFITKLAAGTLTVILWASFAWEDIWGTIEEYSAFEETVKKARTAAELKAAGDRLARKIGAVGFDILMMIATWGLGKAAGPKLKAAGARRGVVRAEGALGAAAADPAAGVPKAAQGPAKTLLADAKAQAQGSTPTAVLDALEPKLDDSAKQGLRSLRSGKAGDMGTYKAVESQANKGWDINHFLSEKAATPEAKTQAQTKLLAAETKVARATLIENQTIADPALRKAARTAQMNDLVKRFKTRLNEMGLLDDPKVKKALQDHNLKDLTSAMGEAISRQQLRAELTNPAKSSIVSNLAVAVEVPGYKTIEQWKQATNASPKDVDKMLQGQDRIYRSLGQIDSMVVEDTPGGKPKATLIEEVKTGASDQPTKALKQVTEKVFPALQKIVARDKSVKVFELVGKNKVGAERTGDFDFSGNIQAQTRGPEGRKGFQHSLGFDPEVLEKTAETLIQEGLPPAKPQTIPPVTGLKPKEEATK